MPCDSIRQPDETPQQRRQKVRDALKTLEQRIKERKVNVVIGPQGAAALVGWSATERNGVTDACAMRKLLQENSWELRQAIERAQTQSGRKLNIAAVNGGTHSHDGGKTWHPGH